MPLMLAFPPIKPSKQSELPQAQTLLRGMKQSPRKKAEGRPKKPSPEGGKKLDQNDLVPTGDNAGIQLDQNDPIESEAEYTAETVAKEEGSKGIATFYLACSLHFSKVAALHFLRFASMDFLRFS